MTARQHWNPEMVWVQNNNKNLSAPGTSFTDTFDGQPFAFPFSKRVKCQRLAANHFFAIDAKDRLAAARQYANQRTPEAQAELAAATANWESERVRVLTRNSWNLQVKPDGTVTANAKADEILAGFSIEPVNEPLATDAA